MTIDGRLNAKKIEHIQGRLEGIYESTADYWNTPAGLSTIIELEEELDRRLRQCTHINSDGNFVTKDGICMVCSAPV
jgi:hypothetical protein